jgi:hypothetical protein
MTPDGQLLSADSFQLLMSDGSSSSSSSLLQAEDIQALLSSSSPTAAVGNSPPGPQRSAVDHRHLGLNTATGTPYLINNKRVEMASLGLPETSEHRHLAVSSSGMPHSADSRRMVATSSKVPNTVDHQRFESPTCAGGSPPPGTAPISSPRQPSGHVMFGETVARSGTGSASQIGTDSHLAAHESPSNILPNGELSPVGGRTDPAGGKINNPAQYFVTKCGTTGATGSRRVHKSVAKNNNYSSSSSSRSCPPTATTMQTAVTTAVPEVAPTPKVLVTRNMISGRPAISGVSGGGSAAKIPALPPEIVFPREPLLPAEIQGFVSGLGYSAGDLPPFAASATPPPAVVMLPPPAAIGGKGSARSTTVSSNKANNKSRSRTKENMKVLAAA